MYFFENLLSFLKDREYQRLLRVTSVILVIGTIVYHYIEGWTWLDSFYFSIITLTTIGYGDFSPQTTIGKLFTILYILIGIGIILGFIDTVYKHYKTTPPRSRKK